MSRTTFSQRFDKTQKFFDNAYHHHKATYKGLAQFFQSYSEIEKLYANSLLKQAQKVNLIPDFAKEQPYIQQGVREIGTNLQKISQLHYNFGERLLEMGVYCQDEYLESKRQKQKFMKLTFERPQQEHDRIKDSGPREKVNLKQQQICKNLYDTLSRLMEDEASRTQKLKQQSVIYFSVYKKIAQRQVQLASAYNLKMGQYEVNVKIPELYQIEDLLVEQYNGYSEDKLLKQNREVNQQISMLRESLRQSMVHREKVLKVEDCLNKMTLTLEKYRSIPEELNYPNEDDYLVGIFDRRVLPQYKQFSRQFRSDAVKQIAFAWLWSYHNVSDNGDNLSLLTVVKANLKVRHIQLNKTKSVQQFVSRFIEKSDVSNRSTLQFLMQLSQVYEGTLRVIQLQHKLKNKQIVQISNYDRPFHWKIQLVLIDYLLQSVIIVHQGFSILYDEYVDIFKLIYQFARSTFNIDSGMVMSLLLRKVQRVMEVVQTEDPQRLQQILQEKINFKDENELSSTEELKMQMGHKIINFLTQKMSNFYKCKLSFSNLIKISLVLQKILPKNYFTAIQHMHSCIKIAGFNFFEQSDEDKRLLQGVWRGEQRLKNLAEVLQQLQLDQVYNIHLYPIARELSKLLGVGYEVISGKMRREFSQPIFDIIRCNLQLLCEQVGRDTDGYVLRLGICLSMLDLKQPQDIGFYSIYFNALQNYLTSTEKQYSQLLQHARKTELWIVEDNSQATQNCVDFCSLLYKPFQFLLTSLKKLDNEKEQTQFTKKFSDFIKLKLNKALKGQIQKYVAFLQDSLRKFFSKQPQFALKYKRLTTPYVFNNEEAAKQRSTLREITRRLFNLLFLKDQLDQIICDFIQPQIYKKINSSIFNLELLAIVANTHPTYKQILTNIYDIASLISKTHQNLVKKVADIAVFHFMRRLFANLYFQEQKGFFSSDKDYKLSQYTFVKAQQQLQEFLLNVGRNLPAQTIDAFSKQFSISICKAYRFQILDVNKFKIPIKLQKIIAYLDSDLNFFCNLIKQKFMLADYVKEYIEEPCQKLLRDIQKSTQRLTENFSEASLQNQNENARYYLAILNLKRDDKAQQFVQKYKKILK